MVFPRNAWFCELLVIFGIFLVYFLFSDILFWAFLFEIIWASGWGKSKPAGVRWSQESKRAEGRGLAVQKEKKERKKKKRRCYGNRTRAFAVNRTYKASTLKKETLCFPVPSKGCFLVGLST